MCAADAEVSIRDADRVLGGETCYFFRHWVKSGFPPDWFADRLALQGARLSAEAHPIVTQASRLSKDARTGKPSVSESHESNTGFQPVVEEEQDRNRQDACVTIASGNRQDACGTKHWSEVSDFGNTDIKIIWEPSRFAFAFPLARAYEAKKDEKYADGFWAAVEDWRDKNPPNCGPNWMCGQEIAIRMIAWLHGYGLLRHSQATTEDRVLMLAQMVAVSAERIEANIGYALSQNNNHGISEAAGLFTAGVAVGVDKWMKKGRRLLESQARCLIYEDGSFSQHSVNYHCVMLDVYHWVLELGKRNGLSFSGELQRRVDLAEEWLAVMTDPISGQAPNLGCNDGAWVLPRTKYLEYRG